MKKVIRLTESDLVRLVKRVISEQENAPEEAKIRDLKAEISNLQSQINQARKTNTKEDINKIVDICKDIWESIVEKIQEMKIQLKNERDSRKKQRLLKTITKLESLAKRKDSKLNELSKTGAIFTTKEKEYLLVALGLVTVILGCLSLMSPFVIAAGFASVGALVFNLSKNVKNQKDILKKELPLSFADGDYDIDLDMNFGV